MVSKQIHQGHYQLAWICYSLSLLNADICILKAFQSEGSAKAHGTFIRDDILSVSLRFRGYRVVHVCMYILFPVPCRQSTCAPNASTLNVARFVVLLQCSMLGT
jgi:hypothetical protein